MTVSVTLDKNKLKKDAHIKNVFPMLISLYFLSQKIISHRTLFIHNLRKGNLKHDKDKFT